MRLQEMNMDALEQTLRAFMPEEMVQVVMAGYGQIDAAERRGYEQGNIAGYEKGEVVGFDAGHKKGFAEGRSAGFVAGVGIGEGLHNVEPPCDCAFEDAGGYQFEPWSDSVRTLKDLQR